jgi:hypothetical protein
MVFSLLAASCRCCAENPPIPAVQIPGTTSFADGSMHFDIFAGPASLSGEEFFPLIELYVAYFNRAADAMGLFYWASRFAEGLRMREIAE